MWTRRKFIGTSAFAFAGVSLQGKGFITQPPVSKTEINCRISLNTSTIRTYKLGIEEQIDACKKAGFDGIELWMSDIQEYKAKGNKLSHLAQKLKENNLVLENIIGFAKWAADDSQLREAGQQQMCEEMEITAMLGGKYIAAPMMGIEHIEPGKLDEYSQRYAAILEFGRRIGVTPLLEIWGAGALHKLTDSLHIALGTGHPQANVLLDFYHLYRGGNHFESLNLLNVERMPLFHMNDYPAAPPREKLKDSDRVYPGDGICPYASILPLLYENGFGGAFSVELFNEEYCRKQSLEQMLHTTFTKAKQLINQTFK